jgi:hypothetical protein
MLLMLYNLSSHEHVWVACQWSLSMIGWCLTNQAATDHGASYRHSSASLPAMMNCFRLTTKASVVPSPATMLLI